MSTNVPGLFFFDPVELELLPCRRAPPRKKRCRPPAKKKPRPVQSAAAAKEAAPTSRLAIIAARAVERRARQ